jgi:IclR helix-turn-helix domain/Bacterial transcriptional regulator
MSRRARSLSLPEGEPAWSTLGMRDPRFSQSLERGLAVLGVFRPGRCVLGVSELAEELGMSRSTAHRYVGALVALGYLEQVAQRKYRLGLRVTDLGMTALNSTPQREHAHPYLLELRQRSSYTTSIGVLDGSELTAGAVAIAVAVRNEAREVIAAVGMAADASMISLEELADGLGPHLRAGADRISARLGYRRDDETRRTVTAPLVSREQPQPSSVIVASELVRSAAEERNVPPGDVPAIGCLLAEARQKAGLLPRPRRKQTRAAAPTEPSGHMRRGCHA